MQKGRYCKGEVSSFDTMWAEPSSHTSGRNAIKEQYTGENSRTSNWLISDRHLRSYQYVKMYFYHPSIILTFVWKVLSIQEEYLPLSTFPLWLPFVHPWRPVHSLPGRACLVHPGCSSPGCCVQLPSHVELVQLHLCPPTFEKFLIRFQRRQFIP